MTSNHPQSRRRARAVAISDGVERQRASTMRMIVALAGLAGMAEVAVLALKLSAAHP